MFLKRRAAYMLGVLLAFPVASSLSGCGAAAVPSSVLVAPTNALAHAGALVYLADFEGTVWSLNLASMTLKRVGSEGKNVFLSGIAFDAKTHVLYGIQDSNKELYSISTATGAAKSVCALNVADIEANLTFDLNGTGYALDNGTGTLYSFDPATCKHAALGVPKPYASADGLAFFDAKLQMAESTYGGVLATLNTKTAAVTGRKRLPADVPLALFAGSNAFSLYGIGPTGATSAENPTVLYQISPGKKSLKGRLLLIHDFKNQVSHGFAGGAYVSN